MDNATNATDLCSGSGSSSDEDGKCGDITAQESSDAILISGGALLLSLVGAISMAVLVQIENVWSNATGQKYLAFGQEKAAIGYPKCSIWEQLFETNADHLNKPNY